ncbi:MAG: HAD family hydrolase [Oscillospiraceae bacterium]|nr:HAD family hydrolase [Oscillospiraceae bacterium]
MNNCKMIIFDLDGTILDTLEDLFLSTNYALRKSGFPERSKEEVRCFVGNGIRKLIERSVTEQIPENLINEVHQYFTEYYAQHCADNTKPYAGIPEVLQKLRRAGLKTAVVSNKADYAVQTLCADYFPALFDAVAGEREGIRRKPAPDAVLAVLHDLQIPAEQAIYIGDSDVDIATAENSGIPCISVEWGFRDRAFLIQHGAQKIISVPEELLNLIQQ